MKKLLVLMLVLGMTSLAGAGITIVGPATINETETGVIGIDNSDGLDYVSYMSVSLVTAVGFSMSNPQLTANAGDGSSVGAPYFYDDVIEVEVILAQYEGSSTPGTQFTWDLECLKEGVFVTVDLWDYTTPGGEFLADTLVIEQIPEPMTIALLGLGGLFLLRRRK